MIPRILLPAFVALAASSCIFVIEDDTSDAVRSAEVPALDIPVDEKPPLARGLEVIDPDRIAADLYFIASDELQGRDSPSHGLKVAARFIRARLMRLGFTPGGPEGFLWDYSRPQFALVPERTTAAARKGDRSVELGLGEDYWFTRGSPREASGPVIWGGDLDGNALAELPIDGKWVLCVTNESSARRRQSAAARAGAKGLIVVPAPDYDGAPFAEAYGRYMERSKQPSSREPRPGNAGLLYVGAEAAARVLALSNVEAPKPGDSLGFEFSETCVVEKIDGLTLENVCGIWPGSDPVLRNDVIILSAHYDHVGSRENGDIYNGADDNGSGTCGLLALAEALKAYGPMRRTVMLMWVSAEEKGLVGSAAWTKDPWLPEGMKPICNINIDMIGRNEPDRLHITPTKDHDAYSRLTQVAEKHRESEGFAPLRSADAYWSRSDHANFSRNLKIPVAFLFSDVHEDYHKPTDTPDKIDYDKLHRVVRLVLRMVDDLQADDLGF